ncbi:hypothetical protein [Paenibacillus glycanilyticus]|uniref:hypothetical protein n=1 Tax=Paenibacillus glycanilyticus TaxID=126569 RepID=UPI001910B687|nr:hypothetical protein [Paenibacillus glycanilyticus]
MQVSYRQVYEKYTIAVIPIGDKYDLRFMLKDPDRGFRIELCDSEHYAVEGAKRFPELYEIALKHDFIISPAEGCFKHKVTGIEIDFTYAMDMDCTPRSFEQLILSRLSL